MRASRIRPETIPGAYAMGQILFGSCKSWPGPGHPVKVTKVYRTLDEDGKPFVDALRPNGWCLIKCPTKYLRPATVKEIASYATETITVKP